MGLDLTTLAVAKSYTQKTLNGSGAIKGEKGDKGDPFTYEDFTPEQLELLKGQPGKDGIDGQNGLDGADGQDGITPHIGSNGNWYIGDLDTGINAKGKDGVDGSKGSNGLSAYKIAVNNGFIGTEQEWLESLKGKDGEPGESANLPDIYNTEDISPAENIATEDKFLLGTQEGNRTVTADNFVKFVMDNIDIPDIESPVKVPLVKGYSVLVKDYDTVIAKSTRSVVLFNFSDLGLNIDDVVSIEVMTLQSTYTIALDQYINHETKDFYIIHYAGDNVSTPCTLTVRVCLLVKDSSVKEDSGRVGEIIAYMGTTAPLNYLSCDGAEYNISDFPYLAQHFKTAFGTINHFGGDGETTFAVPDLRGEFLRGTGENSHENSITKILEGSGGTVGEHQESTVFPMSGAGVNPSGTGYFGGMGGYSNTISSTDSRNEDTKTGNSIGVYYGTNVNNGSDYKGVPTIHTARPTNTSVMWCIRYLDTVNGTSETTPLLKGIRAVTIPVDDYFVLNTDYCDIGNISDYGISAESIIGISYNLTVEKSRVAIVNVAVISSSGVIKVRTNGNIHDKTSLEGNVTIFVKDFDVEDVTLDDLPEVTEVSSEDKFLIGVSGENKSITGENLLKSITENLDITPGEVMQVPFLYGYKILVRDFDVTIPANQRSVKVFNLSDFGLSMEDFVSVQVINISESTTLALDHYFNKDDFNVVVYTGTNLSSALPLTVRAALVVKDDTLQLPYIYGYKLVTKEVAVTPVINNRAVTLCPISDLGEDVVADDILSVTSTLNFAGFDNAISCYVDRDTNNIEGMWDYTPSRVVSGIKINIAAILKDTSTVPKEKEPRLRTVSFEKNVSFSRGSYISGGLFATTQELGISNTRNIVSLHAYDTTDNGNNMCFPVSLNDGKDIYIRSLRNEVYTSNVHLDVTVKDYSDIGSEIVTENVKMITKNVTGKFSNSNIGHTGVFLSDLGVDVENVVSITSNLLDAQGDLRSPFIKNDEIILITGNNINVTVECAISIFVRVPVVEQLPRFTKDVEVTLPSNGSSTPLLTLDGSENVGGFTKDNFHSISISGIGLGMYVQYCIKPDGGIAVYNADKTSASRSGTIRITIE